MGKGRLSERDLRATLAFLRANYSLVDHDGFIANVVHGLPRLIASDLTAYCEIDPVRQTSVNWLDRPEVDTPQAARTWQTYMLQDPVVSHYVRTGDGRARKTTDFLSQRQFRDTGVYVEHYRPKRLAYVLATWVPSPQFAIAIGVTRGRRDFSDDERLIMELLRPHLIQGWRNAQLVTRLSRDVAVGRALATSRQDTVVLDRSGAVLMIGERAGEIFAAFFPGIELRDGVPDEVLRWARWLAERLTDGQENVPSRAAPFVRDGDGCRLKIRPFLTESAVVLAVEQLSVCEGRTLPLTPRESEVLAWVSEGKTNEDIARILHCAPKTVEKHLEHIYEKLAVPNRAAAVAAALSAQSAR